MERNGVSLVDLTTFRAQIALGSPGLWPRLPAGGLGLAAVAAGASPAPSERMRGACGAFFFC